MRVHGVADSSYLPVCCCTTFGALVMYLGEGKEPPSAEGRALFGAKHSREVMTAATASTLMM